MGARLPVLPLAFARDAADAPEVGLAALDTVWFQLTGTLCNIACRHCFITCGPKEDEVPMMSGEAVRRTLAEAVALGARDYYFTGGEPMLHPEFWQLCEAALAQGPLTVLTNGILINDAEARLARELFDRARYSFDLRVSLDGMTAAENDPVRGRGTFESICAGIARLAREGLSPALTVVEHASGMAASAGRARFLEFARSLGLRHPRVKFLPLLRIGREEHRTRGYQAGEVDCLTQPIDPRVVEELVCASSRLVTANGVMTCPILLDAPDARLGQTLADSLHPIKLRWSACRTCVVDGLSCRT
jgi:sulfatase maturation enzyme AslB (radical SAM superfamily)